MPQPSYAAEPAQTIESSSIDPYKLMRLLEDVYGTSEEGKTNFMVEVSSWSEAKTEDPLKGETDEDLRTYS